MSQVVELSPETIGKLSKRTFPSHVVTPPARSYSPPAWPGTSASVVWKYAFVPSGDMRMKLAPGPPGPSAGPWRPASRRLT